MHAFHSSALDSTLCSVCKRLELDHGITASCEACPYIGQCEIYSSEPNQSLLLCPDCIKKEEEIRTSPEKQQERVNKVNTVIQQALDIDSSIQVRTDLFNANTVAIINLKAEIDNDATIENKNYRLAEILTERFNHHKAMIFEQQEDIVKRGNDQKAIQSYLNTLANQLRAEEREKLKISDISYQPTKVKPVKVTAPKTAKPKLDKAELRNQAAKLSVELGQPIPEYMLQMLVVSKGVTVEVAADLLRRSIKEARSE